MFLMWLRGRGQFGFAVAQVDGMRFMVTVKPVLSRHSKKIQNWYCLMQVKSIAEYFCPALSDKGSLRPLFCLFLSDHLRQVTI